MRGCLLEGVHLLVGWLGGGGMGGVVCRGCGVGLEGMRVLGPYVWFSWVYHRKKGCGGWKSEVLLLLLESWICLVAGGWEELSTL